MKSERICVVLSFDSNMFQQAQECIKTIQSHCKENVDICVFGIELRDSEVAWLHLNQFFFSDELRDVPTFKNAPIYGYAQTCRPYLREIFPGYDVYIWIDADIRIAHSSALDYYIDNAVRNPSSIVISQEVDSSYIFVSNPEVANKYQWAKYQRICEVYGQDIATHLTFFYCFNSGIFSIHRSSPIWDRYKKNLEKAVATVYHHVKEQDAMNVSIVEDGMNAVIAPPCMNWLCSCSLPKFQASSGRWVSPTFPHTPISVLHLTSSSMAIKVGNDDMTYYDFYKKIGLTE